MSEGIGVYKAIAAVQGELATEGISKDRTCTQGASYKFRGIDDVYNALAPILAKHNLCIIPRMLTRELIERQSKAGGALFYTVIEAEFDFVSAEDGSKHTARTIGEAMDSGDKGCNKAMSAAYKYAAFQTFCIPTEGDNDTENQTHEVKPKTLPKQQPKQELAEVQATLGMELSEFCNHDTSKMKDVLKEVSFYVKNKGQADEKEAWIKLEDILKPSSHAGFLKWCGSALSKLRDKRDKKVDEAGDITF